MIKSDKLDLFFNQFGKWKNKENNSLNEKLKSLILLQKSQNMVWNIIIYLEQPFKSRKYQNNIMET